MLKIAAVVNNRRTVFFGLDRENTTRMHAGEPVVVDVQTLLQAHRLGDVQDIVICAAETLEELHAELSKYLPLPPFQKSEE